jgi:TrmH family RNA methyltransferase
MKLISSLANPQLKAIAGLRHSANRRKTATFMVEGAREIAKALAADYSLQTFLLCPALYSDLARTIVADLERTPSGAQFIELSASCFNSLVMRKDSDGILAVFAQQQHPLSALSLGPKPLVLALENVEKPGNLGAILRSADGAGVSAVVVLSASGVDLYHPHAIRASLGTVFSLPLAVASNEAYYAWCQERQISVYAACLSEQALDYTSCAYQQSSSILVGSEAWGLSEFWQKNCSQQIYIPMQGKADSLNVSVAAGVLLFEARRQRNL